MNIEQAGRLVSATCLVVLLSACGAPKQRTTDAPAGAQPSPGHWALEDGRLMPLDTGQSRVVIRVYRGAGSRNWGTTIPLR